MSEIPAALRRVPDPVKRVKHEMDMHAVAGSYGFVAFAIEDGSPLDHSAYETYADALRAMKWNRENYFVIEVQPEGMSFEEATAVLGYARFCRQMGGWVPAPEEADKMPAPGTIPYFERDQKLMARQLATGRRIPDHLMRNINPATGQALIQGR